MQFPVSFHIGSFSFPLHAVLETLGIFFGFRFFLYLRRKGGDVIAEPARIWIVIGAVFGALLGSRLLGALEDPVAWRQAVNPFLYLYQNKTVVGGFLGGLIGVEVLKKVIGEKKASGDLFVFPLLLALIIGRVGCFSMGVYEETYGLPTRVFTGMDLGDGVLRHPVALYEILFLLLFWGVLYWLRKTLALQNGALFKMFLIGYLLFRFVLDFIKPHFTFGIGLSSIQVACVLGILYYLPYLIQPKKLLAAYA